MKHREKFQVFSSFLQMKCEETDLTADPFLKEFIKPFCLINIIKLELDPLNKDPIYFMQRA